VADRARLEIVCAARYRGFESLPFRHSTRSPRKSECYTSDMIKLFEVHQKITLLVNEYHILKDGRLAGYVKQKRFTLREHFSLYKDEQQKEILATSQARQVLDVAPTFNILDDKGQLLGVIKKDFKKSLLRSSWSVYRDADTKELLFKVQEKNLAIAIIRRLWELIPIVEAEIPLPIKFHFTISKNDKPAGEYNKLTLFRDRYALNIDESAVAELDERAWMIFAVLLDAMQSR
jgi:uncharacterized protein YxjI